MYSYKFYNQTHRKTGIHLSFTSPQETSCLFSFSHCPRSTQGQQVSWLLNPDSFRLLFCTLHKYNPCSFVFGYSYGLIIFIALKWSIVWLYQNLFTCSTMLGNWVFSSFRNSARRCSRVYVFGWTYVYFIRYISVSGGDKSLHKLSFSFPQWLYQFTLPPAL